MNRRQFLESAVYTSALSALPIATLAQLAAAPTAPYDRKVWEKPEFEVRGLEIHSRRMWDWKSVSTAFSLMEKLNLNMLVFHQDNLQDAVVWPDKYFPREVRTRQRPIQGLQTRGVFLMAARDYLRSVASEAKKRNIKFFLEITEIEYGEGLEQIHPEIRGTNGAICPTSPFWWDFLTDKYTELFEIIPGLDGVIVSPGTFESKVSITNSTCDCARCKATKPAEWYTKLISSMYEPFEKNGKTLVVRDFSYTKANQTLLMDAVQSVSPNIVAALKNTPHDFYLTFPNNPRIGHVGRNRQWIEFDCWGQFYGCGLFPVSVVEDMQRRLVYDRANGATGVWFRTDLESMTDESVFNSFNQLNLVAGALLSQSTTQNNDDLYQAWLQIGLFDVLVPESLESAPVSVPPAYLPRLRDFMKASYAVALKTFYVRGFLFYINGRFFDNVDDALIFMKVHAGLEDWEPGANNRIELTDENIAAIIAEKDAALAEVQRLPGILQAASLPIPSDFKAHIDTVLSLYREYVRGSRLCAIGIFRAKQAALSQRSDQAQLALKAADDLQQYRAEIANLLGDKYFPQNVHRAFDLRCLDLLDQNIRDICLPLSKGSRT